MQNALFRFSLTNCWSFAPCATRLRHALWVVRRFNASTSVKMDPVIRAADVHELAQQKKIKILDATFSMVTPPLCDWETYQQKYFGKFDKIMAETTVPEEYQKEHIPGAVHFDLSIGMYVGRYSRFTLYPPEIFEQYAQLLGINNGDHVVVYGRGALAGMLFASKVWWLFKYYGLEKVQVLNGGITAWTSAGYPVDNKRVSVKRGNFTATVHPELLITFEELEKKGADNKSLLNKLDQINFYDTRPREQYNGESPQKFTSSGEVTGYHLEGSKSLPAVELVTADRLNAPQQIIQSLKSAGYMPGQRTVTACAAGIQAAFVVMALEQAGIKQVQCYHGSLNEMALRCPEKISGK